MYKGKDNAVTMLTIVLKIDNLKKQV